MVAPRQGLTLAEFLARPETKPALEYADGVVTRKAAPKGRHSTLQTELVERLNRLARRRRSARALTELRATFGGRSYVPDVVVFGAERIPRTPEGQIADDVFAPPDIAIEIVSPRQSVTPLVRRCLWYVANGVAAALLVDPRDRSIIVFRTGGQTAAMRGAEVIDLSDVAPGLVFSVDDVFASLSAEYWP
ncbi:MAG TPA: Uma2 family endonuclease [Chloroflexota bacterium]|nr:Uma2 family endonuclease [Chloroflexota bacterium]